MTDGGKFVGGGSDRGDVQSEETEKRGDQFHGWQ
jgi:hypothetical protein